MHQTEQAYLEKLFPNGRELPGKRLIPCLLLQDRRTEVLFLYKAGPEEAHQLRPEHDAEISSSDIVVFAADREGDGHADLQIAMELRYPDFLMRFTGAVQDAEGHKQAAVAKALLLVKRVALFVATEQFEFVAFKAFDWNPASQPVLENILRGAAQEGAS
ncbi:hypothetical protein [Gorillibacterium sp. sgz5001074]|uniref:hypothetical protein n=1 Tax=Gorillibacterium sp. sgz5001074 TaxID=3446695 RepID=UPI003F673ED5